MGRILFIMGISQFFAFGFCGEWVSQLNTPGLGETLSYFSPNNGGIGASDDFIVPEGQDWNIRGLQVVGRFIWDCRGKTSNEPYYFRVRVYEDQAGLPGNLIAIRENQPAIREGALVSINLDETILLPPGHYWLSVQFFNSCFFQWQTSSGSNGYPFSHEDGELNWVTCGGTDGCGSYATNPDLDNDLMFALYDHHLFSSVPALGPLSLVLLISVLAVVAVLVNRRKTI